MEYRAYKDGIKLSRLGMGNMRLPVRADVEGRPIDYEKAKAIIDRAMAMGINYYDTAYIYHGGESEVFTGKALAEYPRESYYVADKYNLDAEPDYTKQFPEQLRRLNLDCIDFYLLHGVMDHNVDTFMNNGCFDYFDRMKAEGKIRYFGFSFHGTPNALRRMVSLRQWDFVQIQLNYYDYLHGDAKELYEILDEAGIPIMVMEPVRGGLLAKLNEDICDQRFGEERALYAAKNVEIKNCAFAGQEDGESALKEASNLNIENCDFLLRYPLWHADDVKMSNCRPCPVGIDVDLVNKYYDLAQMGDALAIEHYKKLEVNAASCIQCGHSDSRCPFSVNQSERMAEINEYFSGK